MISFFKDKSPVSVFLLIVLLIALHSHLTIEPIKVQVSVQDGYLFYFLAAFKNVPQVLPYLLGIVIFLTSLQVNFVFNSLKLFTKNDYTSALAFVLLSSVFSQWNAIFSGLIAQSLILWVFYFSCKMYNSPKAKPLIFNIGFFSSITIILYFSSFPIILFLFIALAILRPFRLNEWFALFLGILTPFYFLVGYFYLNDTLKSELVVFISNFKFHKIICDNFLSTLVTLISIIVFILYGLITERNNSTYASLPVRKSWALILWMFLLFIPVGFVVKESWPQSLFLLMLPVTAYVSYIFNSSKIKIISIIVFWLLLSLSVYNNWVVH